LTPVKAVLAVDGSGASKRAANAVKNWLDPEDVTLCVLSAVPQVLTDIAPKILPKKHLLALTEPFYQRAEELTSQYRSLFIKEGYEVHPDVLQGNPREVILEHIRQSKAQLAVLGSKGLTGPERFQMGSVSEWVAAYSSCSVLVVRPRPT
jgi:nucleotide-binding universal stress UspA family protein